MMSYQIQIVELSRYYQRGSNELELPFRSSCYSSLPLLYSLTWPSFVLLLDSFLNPGDLTLLPTDASSLVPLSYCSRRAQMSPPENLSLAAGLKHATSLTLSTITDVPVLLPF